MQLDAAILNQHRQLEDYSCIPMSVELVLKFIGRVPADYFALQQEWANRRDGSFAAFDGREIAGVRFRLQFGLPRNNQFPLNDLFHVIENELAAGRFVIVSLAVPGGWHMFVIFEQLPTGEFRAISKVPRRSEMLLCEGARATILRMKGTDILTYEVVA